MPGLLIKLIGGADYVAEFVFRDAAGMPVDLTGSVVRLLVTSASGQIEWSSANGFLSLVNAAEGHSALHLTATQIGNLDFEFADYEQHLRYADNTEEILTRGKIWRV